MIAQRFQYRIDLLGYQHEITGDCSLPAASGLKIDRVGRAHWRRDIHIAVLDRFGARDTKLIDTAVIGALGAECLIQGGGVEIDWRWWGRCSWSSRKWCLTFSKRRVEHRSQLHRIAIPLHMHVHREGLVAEEMI